MFFFCTGRGAMCAERHKSPSRIRMGSVRNEPDKHEQRNQTKTQKPPKTKQEPTTTEPIKSGSCPYESKRAKGADPRTNTGVKRGAEFISSRSQYRTSRTFCCILLPPTVHSVCMCMSRLKARVRCKSGLARSMRSKALHNLYQRMRARKRPCRKFQGDQNRVNSTSPLRSKISVNSCLGLFIAHLGCLG